MTILTDDQTLAKLKPTDGRPLVFLAIPTYDRRIDIGTANAILKGSLSTPSVIRRHNAPLLAFNFNAMFCEALNLREKLGVTHFCLLHADVIPADNWLVDMLAELKRGSWDALSAVVPLKDMRGLTSCGLDVSGLMGNAPWKVRRLTMTELQSLPETFTGNDVADGLCDPVWPSQWPPLLCINTGLFMIDLRKPWVEKVCFTIQDKIIRDPETGLFEAFCDPEDWGFSRQMAALGVRYAATRKIRVHHVGNMEYDSHAVWGEPTDPTCVPEKAEAATGA